MFSMGALPPNPQMAEPTLTYLIIRLLLFLGVEFMRCIQYSEYVEVFNCLIALEGNVGGNDCTYSIKSAL